MLFNTRMEQKILIKVLSQVKHGTLNITFWDGTKRSFGSGKPKVDIKISSAGILRKAIRKPSLVLGEAYTTGQIELNSPLEDMLKFSTQSI
jgi:hypothetical protein